MNSFAGSYPVRYSSHAMPMTDNTGWCIAGVVAAICIVGIIRIIKDKAICYYNVWDFLAGVIPVIAIGVGMMMKGSDSYDARQNGIIVLWISSIVTVIYHTTLAVMYNHRTWFDAPVMFTCRLCGIVVTVGGIILAWVIGSTSKHDRESDGEYIMRAISAKAQSAAIGLGVGWMACWLINGERVAETRELDVEYTPYRHVEDTPRHTVNIDADVARMGSLAMLKNREKREKPVVIPELAYRPNYLRGEPHTYMYRWQSGSGAPIAGVKMCESEIALRDHVNNIGGKLIEVLEIDGKRVVV